MRDWGRSARLCRPVSEPASAQGPRNWCHQETLILISRIRMNNIRTKELYSSPNGDRWHLCRDGSGCLFIAHQANLPSGGQISRIELAEFLSRGYGPEQQSLLQLIGTLMDKTPGELAGGEGSFADRGRWTCISAGDSTIEFALATGGNFAAPESASR
jgi:hypothetical protein